MTTMHGAQIPDSLLDELRGAVDLLEQRRNHLALAPTLVIPPPTAAQQALPVVFSINGYMGNMWAGPQAEVAAAVQRNTGSYWQPLGFDSSPMPLNAGVNNGIAEFKNQRAQHPGRYIVTAWSEGAIIAMTYLQWQLSIGNADCLGGVFFGSPYRAAGQWNPIAPAIGAVGDPGGAGVGGPGHNWRTPDTIHTYCHGPNQPSYDNIKGIDQYTACSTGLDGDVARIFYNWVFAQWLGGFQQLFAVVAHLATQAGVTVIAMIQAAIEWIQFFAGQCLPHTDYTSYAGAAYLTSLVKSLP